MDYHTELMVHDNDRLLSFFTVTMDIDKAKKELGYYVTVSILNVTVQGLPDTGKSSLIDLAMGELPNLGRQSTGVAEPPQCFIVLEDDSSENIEWQKLPPQRMLDALCKTIQDRLAERVNVQHETGATPTLPTPLFSNTSLSPISPSSDIHPQSALSLPEAPSLAPLSLPPLPGEMPLTKSKLQDYPQILRDIIKQLPEVTEPTTLSEARLILMSDSGGQPNFLDVFPLFVRNKCLAIYTLKLNERLDATPKISYRVKDRSISMTNTYSYWRLLESLAKSMSHLNAQYAIYGTFFDKKDQCEDETIEEKNDYIANRLKAYDNFRFNHKADAAIFPVNTITEDASLREEYRNELRQLIKSAEPPSNEKNIKLLWFAFYLSLLSSATEKRRDILRMKECLGIGRSLGMNDHQETKEAIKFFHDLNLIFHCELDGFVIVKLERIFEFVSCLICGPKSDLCDHFGIRVPRSVQIRFQEYGCLDQETLKKYFRCKFPEPLNAKDCVSLLAELKAIAITDTSPITFFMPCVLRYASTEEESEIVKRQRHCPWMIRLVLEKNSEITVPLPPSFSPTLIVMLLSRKSFKSNKAQYRNIFTLRYSDKGDVVIIERQLQLEIYYSFSDNVDSECFEIRTDIRDAIRRTKKQLSIPDTVEIEDSFPCSCSPQTEDKPCQDLARHIPCEISRGRSPCARCDRTGWMCDLNEQQLRWLVQGMLI